MSILASKTISELRAMAPKGLKLTSRMRKSDIIATLESYKKRKMMSPQKLVLYSNTSVLSFLSAS